MTLEVVVTARPSWARVKSLVLEYQKLSGAGSIRLSLVGPAVSKRYGDVSLGISNLLEVKKFPALHESDEFGSVALTCLDGATALARYWEQDRPSAVLVIADRTETLGVSLTAALMQIPLIHLQGGEISGSIDDKIRDTNSKLADIHLTTNDVTAKRLIDMGENPDLIHVVGCPSIDLVLNTIKKPQQIRSSDELGGVGAIFDLKSKFGIIMFHPDTFNEKDSLAWIDSIIDLIGTSKINWFWFWPNPDHGTNIISKQIRRAREQGILKNVRFVINLEPESFISLANYSKILIGNSSFGIREASFLGLPVINLGQRQKGRQRGANVFDIESVQGSKELFQVFSQNSKDEKLVSSFLYGDGNSGKRAAAILSSWKPTLKIRV